MNVFYFVKRFPRRYMTANQQKIFSLTQTFLNQGYKMHLVSADLSPPQQYQHLQKYPINLVHVSSKRISASLSAAQVRPDIAVFNNFQMEEMYSAYMYNKWNKCPRILEVNYALGLEKWRKSKYSMNSAQFLVPYNQPLYDQKTIFNQSEKKSIIRSDYFFTPNDFLYHLIKTETKQPQRIAILPHGYRMQQYKNEVKKEEYRPFQNRKHFVFLGDLSKDHSAITAHALAREIWPKIKQKLPQAELHIYSSGGWKQVPPRDQLEKNGIVIKGYTDDVEILQRYRVLLYPARWSVGMKSKVIESWLHHTPVVTTPIGAEGMFFETIDCKFTVPQGDNASGFINQRQLTQEEIVGELKVKQYYNSNSLSSSHLKGLSFGGSFMNFSQDQFVNSAVETYTNKQKWQQALKIGQKTILKNQPQSQLEINLSQALAKLELAAYKARGGKAYEQEWKRIMKNKEYQKKIHNYP